MNKVPRPTPKPKARPDQAPSSAAPQTSIRPQARPADLGPRTPGLFPGMDIKDETSRFGGLAYGRPREPSEVVLHQTDSSTADSVRGAYDQRIQQGSNIGAHYLIDTDGETSLTVPTDRKVGHTVGHNNEAVGIETVGRSTRVDPRGDMHAQIGELDLTPKLKERLLALSPAELRAVMRDNGHAIYQDITAEQKRANWNLINKLAQRHGIDVKEDVHAHEHVQAKTIGEGENVEEMVDAMATWPERIEQLRDKVERLRAEGQPETYVGPLEALLFHEESTFAAVEVDATVAESNALEGEAILGESGAATGREEQRERFWGMFYPHMRRLDGAIAS